MHIKKLFYFYKSFFELLIPMAGGIIIKNEE